MVHRRARTVLTTASAVALITLTGCSADEAEVEPNPEATVPPAADENLAPGTVPTSVAEVYHQVPVWEECDDLECARVYVPIDWMDPASELTHIAINRHPATSADQRIGSLLVNPGGPAGSGLDFTQRVVDMAGDRLVASYDIVGFDRRGVGESSPVTCGTDEQMDEYFLQDQVIETQADLDVALEQAGAFAERCLGESGALLEHVGTPSAARDMDVIRAVLGDEQMYYLGVSYGTRLGAMYAQYYPENVGRMVLDGGMLFNALPWEEQMAKFEAEFSHFLQWCTEEGDCPLTGDEAAQKAQMSELMDQVLADPLPTGTDWNLNRNLFYRAAGVGLYGEERWPAFKAALTEIVDEGTGAAMYELANVLLFRDATTGEYQHNFVWAGVAINCVAAPPGTDLTIEDLQAVTAQMEQASPTFGSHAGTDVSCVPWPFTTQHWPRDLDQAAAVGDQLLVVGTTRDAVTPYEWSESLAESLDAPLLTYEGTGHGAYGRSNQCVTDAVDGFLVDGKRVAAGTTC